MRHLIFDYDGVIADTWEIGIQALVDLGICNSLDKAREFRINHFSHKPLHQRTTETNQVEEKEMLIMRTNQMTEYFLKKGYSLFEEFVLELKKVQNAQMAVVSSRSQKSLIPYIQKTNLPFTHVLYLEDSLSKEWKINNVINDWNVRIEDV